MPKINELVSQNFIGAVQIKERGESYLVARDRYWRVTDINTFVDNGWSINSISLVENNFLDGRKLQGDLNSVNLQKYSPITIRSSSNADE